MALQKACKICKEIKSFIFFGLNNAKKDGYNIYCKPCLRLKDKLKPKRKRNKEERQRANKKWSLKTKESRRNIRLTSLKKWLENNPDYHKNYRKLNPGKLAAKLAKYRARKLQATPKWLTKAHILAIEDFYAGCPKGFEVDHIVPLQAKEASGLHVLWNLQYLPKVLNRKKGNKLWL